MTHKTPAHKAIAPPTRLPSSRSIHSLARALKCVYGGATRRAAIIASQQQPTNPPYTNGMVRRRLRGNRAYRKSITRAPLLPFPRIGHRGFYFFCGEYWFRNGIILRDGRFLGTLNSSVVPEPCWASHTPQCPRPPEMPPREIPPQRLGTSAASESPFTPCSANSRSHGCPGAQRRNRPCVAVLPAARPIDSHQRRPFPGIRKLGTSPALSYAAA